MLRHMRSVAVASLATTLLGLFGLVGSACKDVEDSPFAAVPLDGDFDVDVSAPVHVMRDEFGIAHIDAETLADAAYVQGYVMAHDRLPQMDILRRFGAGTLGELFGALDPSVIDTDLEMRAHRMRPLAEQAWAQLQASANNGDPIDAEVVTLLQRFSDGVNAYAAAIRTDEEGSTGLWVLDPNLLASFDPRRFEPWHPVDSLVLGRFQAFALSWTTPFELDLTELYQGLRDTFDNPAPNTPEAERTRIAKDIMRFKPLGLTATIDGFPNVDTDRGTRSDGSGDAQSARVTAAATSSATRPRVPRELFARARTFFRRGIHTGPFGALGPHAFMQPYAGSNNWAVGPERTASNHAILATDQHLQLPNPSIFYPTHLRIRALSVQGPTTTSEAEPLDLLGITFPGIPGVILGTNGHVAWSGTVSYHDVNDVYLETITPCAAGSCTELQGTLVPIETFTETIDVGALGTFTQPPITATYELVPHHGPIIPEIDPVTHRVVPRNTNTALSVKYTGYEPTFEIRALWTLCRSAANVDDAFRALAHFSYGSQNWTMIDRHDNVGWTTNAVVPDRDPGAYEWNIDTFPDGLAPFFVLPGDGGGEWRGRMSARYVPHAVLRPGELGATAPFIVTANADPVGATFDGDPLNQPLVDQSPLYVGVTYAAGVRHARIFDRMSFFAPQMTPEQMAEIQHDTFSNVGQKLVPHILAALDSTTVADAIAFRATLAQADLDKLARARTLLANWSYATPIGLGRNQEGIEVPTGDPDSAATALFNAWMHLFVEATIDDEIRAATGDSLHAFSLNDNFIARIIHAMLAEPSTFVQGTAGEPILCDAMASASEDTCTKQVVAQVLAAMNHLGSAEGFGTDDPTQWAWGAKHRLKITPLFPNVALDLPGPAQPGFPKTGDNFAVNRSDQGWDDLDFSQSADGPAQRFIAISQGPEKPLAVRWALPGGVIYDSRSPHYRDLLDEYYLPEKHFIAEYADYAALVKLGESRWIFR